MAAKQVGRRLRFRWWMVPAGLGGVVVILIAVGAIILANKDVSAFKNLITAELSKETGRDVQIHGAFELSIGFSPSIVAEEVSMANASWGSRPAMLTARRLEVKVSLFPMLSGRIETQRLVIEGADLLLETNPKGESNWPFTDDGKSSEGQSDLFAADELDVRDSLVTMRDGPKGETRTIKIDTATGGRDPAVNVVSLDAKGTFNDLPLTTKATIGRRGPKAPLKLDLKAGDVALALEGTIDAPADMDGLDVAAVLSADSLAKLGALSGGDTAPPDIGPLSLKGHLTGGGKAFAFGQIDGMLGDTKITGGLKLALADIPRLTGSLAATTIDLDRFLVEKEAAKKLPNTPIFDDDAIDIGWLDDADIELDLSAQKAIYRGTQFADLATTLTVRKKTATLKPLAFKLAGGALDGEARLDASAKVPSLALRGTIRGIELGQALTLLEIDQSAQGKVDIDADLRAVGDSPRSLSSTLAGRLDLAMARGRIDNALVDLLAADLVQRLMPWNADKNFSNVNCMVARFPIERGVMTAERLLLDTDKMTMGGDGTIDLARERLDLRLVPKPKDPSLFRLAVPILVEGPLNNPSAAPDSEAVALGVAGSALGTLINPLGILIPFVSAGSGDKNPCVAALKKGAAEATKKAGGKKKKAGPVDSVIEGVGDGLGSIGKGIGSIFD